MEAMYSAGKFWIDIAQFGLTVIVGIYVWISNRHRVNRQAIEILSKGFAELKTELEVMKEANKNLPTHRDMDDLEKRLDELNKGVASLGASAVANEKLLNVIHSHLMNGGNKA